jgi:hypothetical protein
MLNFNSAQDDKNKLGMTRLSDISRPFGAYIILRLFQFDRASPYPDILRPFGLPDRAPKGRNITIIESIL